MSDFYPLHHRQQEPSRSTGPKKIKHFVSATISAWILTKMSYTSHNTTNSIRLTITYALLVVNSESKELSRSTPAITATSHNYNDISTKSKYLRINFKYYVSP